MINLKTKKEKGNNKKQFGFGAKKEHRKKIFKKKHAYRKPFFVERKEYRV
jgi:hypothetical protein